MNKIQNKNMKSFKDKCYAQLKKVPKGRVTTYKELAKALSTKAYRAVGKAMKNNPHAPKVPCHRVVKSTGDVGEYAQGKTKKIEMLRSEGIQIENNKVKDFNKKIYRF